MDTSTTTFSQHFLAALLGGIQESRHYLEQMARAGESVAERLLSGGRLFIASARPDFTSEGFVRASGLMLLEEWGGQRQPGPKDVVILGWANADLEAEKELLQQVERSGAWIVGIGPAAALSARVQVFLESAPPQPGAVLAILGGEKYPLVALQNLVLLWAFSGELVAALTRCGAMPTIYQSVLMPGARRRNEARQGLRFEAAHEVPPIAAAKLGRRYLERLGGCLDTLLQQESDAIEEIGRIGAALLEEGRQIYAFLISHFPVFQWGAPGDPLLVERLDTFSGETPATAELEEKLEAGDLFFFLGYFHRPLAAYEVARRKGARIVEIITDGTAAGEPVPDYVIRPRWPYGDGLVAVPHYDIDILPASGIVQAAIYWAVVGAVASRREIGDAP